MALSAEEQSLFDWLRASLPTWFFQGHEDEVWNATAKALDVVRAQVDSWLAATYILTAEGPWLAQHARDRNTFPQADEPDETLRNRLRSVGDAVSPAAVLAAAQTALDVAGVVGTAYLVELRRDRAFFNTMTPVGGTGDAFTKVGNTVTLTDAATTFTGWEVGQDLTIAGATTGANNGTFAVGAVTDHSLSYTAPSGVAEAYAGNWQLDALTDGWRHAYFSRGYRMGSSTRPSSFIVILPFGTSEAVAASVSEAVRQTKAGGLGHIVERRANP